MFTLVIPILLCLAIAGLFIWAEHADRKNFALYDWERRDDLDGVDDRHDERWRDPRDTDPYEQGMERYR